VGYLRQPLRKPSDYIRDCLRRDISPVRALTGKGRKLLLPGEFSDQRFVDIHERLLMMTTLPPNNSCLGHIVDISP
jgi:hypothetical protein